ncbi:hypothetical protein BH10ACT3_BH10ACT3_19360 [soil metagenome]
MCLQPLPHNAGTWSFSIVADQHFCHAGLGPLAGTLSRVEEECRTDGPCDRGLRLRRYRVAPIIAVAALVAVVAGCAPGTDDLGYAVTERSSGQELIIDLCGADPPGRLIIARGPTGGIQDPEQSAKYSKPSKEFILFEVDESEWETDQQTFDLGEVSDAPASMQEFMVYINSQNVLGSSRGWSSLPEGPWPTHPLAFTSPFDFTRPVRLDTERGNLCQRS